MHKNISIIGAGTWGVAIGDFLSNNTNVRIFHYNESTIKYLKKHLSHPHLPGYSLSEKIQFTASKNVIGDLCILAVPVQHIRNTLAHFKIDIQNMLILSKGIECNSLMFPTQIIKEILNIEDQNLAVLSGPSHAELLIKKEPTSVVVSSKNKTLSSLIQNIISKDYFRVYLNKDIIGVQLGGAIKNVISIASGIAAGLGYQENTTSALLTRSLKEISILGKQLGASQETIWGLACIGDLMATSFSNYSRNRNFGINIGKGKKYKEIISSSNMAIEGVGTSKSIFNLSKKYEIEMPICNMVYKIIYKNKNPRMAIKELMNRPLKDEK